MTGLARTTLAVALAVSSCAPQLAQAQSVATDKSVYDADKDAYNISFDYGPLTDYGAFISVRPVKDGGSQYDSNAYGAKTGTHLITDHRFPAGEYEVQLLYTDPVKVLASARFKVVSCKDAATVAAEQALVDKALSGFSKDLLKEIADYIVLMTGPKVVPSIKQMQDESQKQQVDRSALIGRMKAYDEQSIDYVSSWLQHNRGLGLGPSSEDRTKLLEQEKTTNKDISAFNDRYQGQNNMATTTHLRVMGYRDLLQKQAAALKDAVASVACVDTGNLKKASDQVADVLKRLDEFDGSVPKFDDGRLVLLGNIDEAMAIVKERARKEHTDEYLKQLGEVLEMSEIPSFIFTVIIKKIFKLE